MSCTLGGPATRPKFIALPPISMRLAGLRATMSKRSGAVASAASTIEPSMRTVIVSRSTIAPASANRSMTRSLITRIPASERMRSEVSWIISSCSGVTTSNGA